MRLFWVLAGLIALFSAYHPLRHIDRPFVGLHSLDQAHNAWLARVHVVYGLGYTSGYPTFAVGSPPEEVPRRYLDHPILYALADAGAMRLLGVDVRTLRLTNIVATALVLLLMMRILRHLSTDALALVSGLIAAQVPLITYFGFNQWLYVLGFSAFWCYLVLIRAMDDAPEPSVFHRVSLAALLFVAVQVQWYGLFFAMAIGVHYVARCVRRRSRPELRLLAILAVPPLAGLALDFVVLAAGDGWNFERLVRLYGWRAGSAEREVHAWGPWFARLGELALTNFGGVVLALALGALIVGPSSALRLRLRFPQFWLFFMPALFQLSLLKGVLWEHEWWERPLVVPVSIAAALGLLMLGDLLGRVHPGLGIAGLVLGLAGITVSTWAGTRHYYEILHDYPERVAMFEQLRERIPADEALLSFESYVFDQNPGVKQSSYRPQVAWYLDRPIVVARRLDEILEQAGSGRYPLYLMPTEHRKPEVQRYLDWLGQELGRRYPSRRFVDSPDQWVFDLTRPAQAP